MNLSCKPSATPSQSLRRLAATFFGHQPNTGERGQSYCQSCLVPYPGCRQSAPALVPKRPGRTTGQNACKRYSMARLRLVRAAKEHRYGSATGCLRRNSGCCLTLWEINTMKKPFTFLAHACLLVCLLTVLLSCKTQEQMSEAATQLPISSPVSTRPEMDSGSRTAEPAKTLPWPTGTGIPVTSSDPTSTAIPVPPTLTSEEKANNLTNLMRAETDCKLPCWWSIIPERSHVAEVKEALEAQGFVWGEDNTARIRVGDIVISLQFEIEEGIIRTI